MPLHDEPAIGEMLTFFVRHRFEEGRDAQQDQVNRPAATDGRQVEGPYRRVRLNAWLGPTDIGQRPISTDGKRSGEWNGLNLRGDGDRRHATHNDEPVRPRN